MPLIEDTDQTPVPEAPNPIRIASPKYRGVTVDTRYIPSTALMTHVEGSPWTVNYYSQVLDDDNALSGQNTSLNPIYQQYRLINQMVLRVVTPLVTAQDGQPRNMNLTGAAHVYPCLIPNEGDMFLADIGDGREGVFQVTSSERRAVFKDSVHFIEYQLIDYSTDERRTDLTLKTLVGYQFVSDFLQYGQNPLLQIDDYEIVRKLQAQYYDIATQYFKSNLSNEYKTLTIPGQEYKVYDQFLTTAATSYFNTDDTQEIRYVRRLNTDGDEVLRTPTIWDVLTTKNKALLKIIAREMGLVSSRLFESNPMLEGIYHSGIEYVVYPRDPSLNVDAERLPFWKVLSDFRLVPTRSPIRRLEDLIVDAEYEGVTLPENPLIRPYQAGNSNYYVLSADFYNKTANQSKLELLVHDYLDNKALDNRVLLALCEAYPSWGALERFYYVPVILILIKASVRSF